MSIHKKWASSPEIGLRQVSSQLKKKSISFWVLGENIQNIYSFRPSKWRTSFRLVTKSWRHLRLTIVSLTEYDEPTSESGIQSSSFERKWRHPQIMIKSIDLMCDFCWKGEGAFSLINKNQIIENKGISGTEFCSEYARVCVCANEIAFKSYTYNE